MEAQAKLNQYFIGRGLKVLAIFLVFSASTFTVVFSEEETKIAAKASDSVYVVSDVELKTFGSMSEVMEANKILKEQRQVLLDHARGLREKYKKLHDFCSKNSNGAPLESSAKLEEENKNLKLSLEKTKQELAAKVISEKAYLEQLETSSSVILRIPEMEKEIVSLKNQLLIKKTTAELLGVKSSDVNNKINDATPAVQAKNIVSQTIQPAQPVEPVQAKSNFNLSSDVTVVEVVADKVSLRVGPGSEHSAIMDVQKGTRLTVEARQGKWLRVNSPTGGRAFISAEFVKGLDGALAQPIVDKQIVVEKDDGFSEQDIQMNIDAPAPIKPAMPKKAPRKVSQVRNDKDVEAFGDKAGRESMAMEKLMQAMQQPRKKDQ